jgi:hypothetical protein
LAFIERALLRVEVVVVAWKKVQDSLHRLRLSASQILDPYLQSIVPICVAHRERDSDYSQSDMDGCSSHGVGVEMDLGPRKRRIN